LVSATAVRGSDEEREAVVVDAVRYATAATLMDSLVHDVRNPLNALAINLEVLTEKLKAETGEVPPSQEKNLRAMREQVGRVDALLRLFSDFMAPRPAAGPGALSLSEAVHRALEVLGHESRRRRLRLRIQVEADLAARGEPAALRFLLLQLLLRAFRRAPAGSEVGVSLRREGGSGLFEVEDSASEPPAEDLLLLQSLGGQAQRAEARVQVRGGLCQVAFSLA
jgi:signal transduction histidine kinase